MRSEAVMELDLMPPSESRRARARLGEAAMPPSESRRARARHGEAAI